MKACRPPEQEPNRPTLPLLLGCARIHCTAGRGVADHLRIGDAAVGPHLGGDVVGIGVAAAALLALIEVGADREIAVMGEAARRLDVELAPARQVMDQNDARELARAFGPRRVGGDRRSLVALHGDVLTDHAAVE
jgi:hypothetical protein